MTLPAWLTPLPDAERMRATDAWAIAERGVPSLELMERAGAGLAQVAGRIAQRGRIVVVCGKGNNGGDGLVAARLLRQQGRDVDVRSVGPVGELQGDARANLERLPGDPPAAFAAGALDGATAIVDAIFGTGFTGVPRSPALEAIAAIDGASGAVVAADVPSGVDASSGVVAGAAVHATATATFHCWKPGLWIAPGKGHAGAVEVIEIGIPAGAPGEADVGLLDERVLDELPRRGPGSTKFSSGALLVCGGSTGLTGAPCLVAQAAMRAGAGYVTAFVPASLNVVFEQRLLEEMTVPMPSEGGSLTPDGAALVLARAARAQALVLGPGLGRTEGAQELARALARAAPLPLVLDADGLNAHAGRLSDLAAREAPTILTPHAGELARLLDTTSAAVEAERLRHAREAAAAARAIVVLKGDDTLIAAPDGTVAVSPGDSPALATAGTGDVLAGAVGALVAQGVEPFAAAGAGVWLHLAAGRLAACAQHGPEGVIAGDVIAALPGARARAAR